MFTFPGHLGHNNTPPGKALVNKFPLRAGLLRTGMLWHISKWSVYTCPWWKPSGILLQYLVWETGWAPGSKYHNMWDPPSPTPCLRSLKFLISRLIHMEPPENYQLQFRFSYPGSGSRGSFCLWVFAPESCSSLCLPSCLSVLGGGICLVSSLIMDPRRLVDF